MRATEYFKLVSNKHKARPCAIISFRNPVELFQIPRCSKKKALQLRLFAKVKEKGQLDNYEQDKMA